LYDKETLKHDVLVPLMTNVWKQQIRGEIEREVEKSVFELMKPIGEKLMSALGEINRPVLNGVSKVRGVLKESEVGMMYERRREKLE